MASPPMPAARLPAVKIRAITSVALTGESGGDAVSLGGDALTRGRRAVALPSS